MQKTNTKFYFDIFIHHKDNGVLFFSDFFDSAPLFTVTGWQFFTVYSQDHKKFRSVGISMLTCIVPEIIAFYFFIFNSV